MLFNSVDFAVFLPIVFAVYWSIGPRRIGAQNLWLLAASYFFYGWWDWRFLGLILASSAVDFAAGLGMGATESRPKRRALLALSLAVNLGLLGFFKYFDFFVENFAAAFTLLGVPFDSRALGLVLPVGISFYTFQTLSYTIDVYRRKIGPTRDVVAFFAFVGFFPQLVAGPIERAANLLPQFAVERRFDDSRARDGLRQMLWGLFKKVAVADTAGVVVDRVFANWETQPSSVLLLGIVLFAFQIYGDFSGYSDIAIGTARLFGFDLMRNFAYPYFARDIAEFWRRWHISLTTWFRDYVYVPLGGSRGSRTRTLGNVLVVFLVSGFWHGANWTFLVWGALNAFYFMPLLLLGWNRRHLDVTSSGSVLPSLVEVGQMSTTFGLTLVAWVFFRAESVGDALAYLARMVGGHAGLPSGAQLEAVPLIALLLVVEWVQRRRQHGLDIAGLPLAVRWGTYLGLIWLVIAFHDVDRQFIYFQF